MPVNIIDGFKVVTSLPMDDKMTTINSTTRDNIAYKYNGLRVFQMDNRVEYIWNESTYISTGITSSSWDIISPVTGQGTYNKISKWMSSGIGLTNTSIISNPKYYGEVSQKVGIGGSPNESFQVNSSYLTFSNYIGGVGTCSPPLVIHKGSHTAIGDNWYYDISANVDKVFNQSFPSGVVSFNNGLKFKGRTSSSSATMSTVFDVSDNGTIEFSPIDYIPSVTNGSIYYNPTTDKVNVGENSTWRTISSFDVYTILLSQSGTSKPTQTLLETTIGTGTWSYQSTGVYNLVIDNGFISAVDISGFCGPYTSTSVFFGEKINSSLYQIRTFASEGSLSADTKLNNTFVEIKFLDTPTPDKVITTTTTTTTTTAAPTTTTTTTSTTTTTTTTAGITFQSIIESGLGIKVDNNLTPDGLMCSGLYYTGCLTSWDSSSGTGIVDDNNILASYNFISGGYPSGINSMRCYFTAKSTSSYNITVFIYKNGIQIGTNVITSSYTSGDTGIIDVTLSSTQDFSPAGTILRLEYYATLT